jgi:hypothetical protein
MGISAAITDPVGANASFSTGRSETKSKFSTKLYSAVDSTTNGVPIFCDHPDEGVAQFNYAFLFSCRTKLESRNKFLLQSNLICDKKDEALICQLTNTRSKDLNNTVAAILGYPAAGKTAFVREITGNEEQDFTPHIESTPYIHKHRFRDVYLPLLKNSKF